MIKMSWSSRPQMQVEEWFDGFSLKQKEDTIVHSLRNIRNFKAQCATKKLYSIARSNKSKSGQVTDLYEKRMKIYSMGKRDSNYAIRKADINGNGVIDCTGKLS